MARWTEWGQENDDDDYDDDECKRQGEGLCIEAQVSCFVEVSLKKLLKVKDGENNLTDEKM